MNVEIEALREAYRDPSLRRKGLIAPLLLFEILVFVIPFAYLVRISLYERSDQTAYAAGTWTLESFQHVLLSEFVQGIVTYTFKFAVVATVLSVLIAVAYAYAIWRAEGPLKTMLIAAITFSLFTTLVVKMFALYLMLSPNGTLNQILTGLSMINEPLSIINTTVGVIIGQVYINLPYAVLAIFGVMATMDESVFEAALDLGASRPRAFFETILPHSIPGIIVATVVSFAWSIGAYSSPLILGSAQQRTIALQIQEMLLTQFDWPAASALALLVLGIVLGVLLSTAYLVRHLGGDVHA